MEIVTWVLEGELEHRDSTGGHGIIYPGLAQRMSAGSGVRHSEMNPSATADVHLVQMWVLPDTEGIAPGLRAARRVRCCSRRATWFRSRRARGHDGAVSIHQRDAVLWVARLPASGHARVPDAPHVHVFVADGRLRRSTGRHASSATGDAARLTAAGSARPRRRARWRRGARLGNSLRPTS